MNTQKQDFVQSFQLDKIGMRGRVVKLSQSITDIIAQHDYPDWVAFKMIESILLNTAIASSIKLRGQLSLQIRSEGAIKLIATDFTAPEGKDDLPSLRGYARFDEAEYSENKPEFVKSIFGIIIDQKTGAQPYQGITPIKDGLTDAAVDYFDQSEQIPTRFHVEIHKDELAGIWRGGVIMVQRLAGEGGVNAVANNDDHIKRIEVLLGTVTAEELLSDELSSEELIYRLFHEDEPTANPAQKLHFNCSCSEEKVRSSLSIYSQKDLKHMYNDEGMVTADCQFCGSHYVMDPKTLGFEAK